MRDWLFECGRHVDSHPGDFVRISVLAFSRDTEAQTLEPLDVALWRPDEGFRVADVVGADDEFARAVELSSGATQSGVRYLYIGASRRSSQPGLCRGFANGVIDTIGGVRSGR